MKIEKLRKNCKSKIIAGGLISLGVIGAITILPSFAKYKLTESINIANGVVNYKVPDFKIMAMYKSEDGINYTETTDRMPNSEYVINEEKSYCTLDNINKDTAAKLYTENGKHIIENLAKGDKCYLYFDKMEVLILSLIDYTFSWNDLNIEKYNIYSNNELLTSTTNTEIELWPFFNSAGTYDIEVRATNRNGKEISSNELKYTIEKTNPNSIVNKDFTTYSNGVVITSVPDNFSDINVANLGSIFENTTNTLVNHTDLFAIFKNDASYCANTGKCDRYKISEFSPTLSFANYYNGNFKSVIKGCINLYYDDLARQMKFNASCGSPYAGTYMYAFQFLTPGQAPSEWIYGTINNLCLDENSIAYVYDRRRKRFKKKRLKNLTYDDEILVWDFDNGCFTTAKPLWIAPSQTAYKYNILKFSNGSILKTLLPELGHRIFNKEKGMFTYPMTDDTPLGTTTFTASGEEAKLISREIVEGEIRYTNIITEYHMNIFTNDILTSCRLNNIYPIKNMKFVKDNRELRDSKEFKNIPEKWFNGIRVSEQPQDINRNNARKWKDLETYINDRESFRK